MAPITNPLFVLSALFSFAYSLPQWSRAAGPCPSNSPQFYTTSQLQENQPTVSGLPSNSNASLVLAAIGIGHQNYTCNGVSYVQSVAGSGALANLYDVTQYLQSHPCQTQNLVQVYTDSNGVTHVPPFSKFVGIHYFDDLDRPTFNLSQAWPPAVLSAAKIDDIKSPVAGNIDWLFLEDNGDGITHGLSEVYRVDTNAGTLASSACSVQGQTQSIAYAAQYWLYNN